MKPRRVLRTLASSVLALASASVLVAVQMRIDERLVDAAAGPDLLYFSSPAGVKKLALGYDSMLADIYWMRAIQYYGRRDLAERRPVRYKNLAGLLDIASSLDPDMMEIYRSGSTFLAEPDPVGAGQPQEAVNLLDKGIDRHPLEWRLQYDKGFIYFWHFKDFHEAGKVWLNAGRLPGAPDWMAGLAASTLSKGGAIETAKMLWRRQFEDSTRAELKENARNHLISIQADEERWTLEHFVEQFAARYGSFPRSLEDLVGAGMLHYVPRDPSGTPYRYDCITGEVFLSPETQITYFPAPEVYREAYRHKLSSLRDRREKPAK
jgi:hypothetical protein